MEKAKNSTAWIEEGYNLFAHEGLGGIQVERLARILQLNKSGFYHYFGDVEVYCEELLKLHEIKANLYFDAVREAKRIDPDYFQILIDFKVAAMFHTQLTRMPNKPLYYNLARKIDQEEDIVLRQLWCAYLGVENEPDLAMRYFNIVRDTFYARISFENMNVPFFRELLGEAKEVINALTEHKSKLEVDEPLY